MYQYWDPEDTTTVNANIVGYVARFTFTSFVHFDEHMHPLLLHMLVDKMGN